MTANFSDYGIDTKGRSYGSIKTLCPKCSADRKKKTDPCLSVELDKQVWHCHNCGWSGGIPTEWEEKPYPDKVQRPPGLNPQPLTPDALGWLDARGIGKDVANHLNYKSVLHWFPQLEKKGPAVAIPFYKNGKCVNIKIRSIETKAFTQHKGGRQVLYNYDGCVDQSIIVMTEGELDTAAIKQAGFRGGVASCPNGAPSPGTRELDNKLDFIDDAAALFEHAETVVLAMDNDEAGVPWAEAIAEKIGLHKCRMVQWPAGCKDANDTLQKHGAAAIIEAVSSAKPVPVPGIVRFCEVEDEIMAYFEQGGLEMGWRTGWPCLDEYLRLDTKTLNILTGIPSSGKSEWLDQLMLNTVENHGWKWAVYSPENYPLENHFQKLAEKWKKRPMFRQYAMEAMTREQVKETITRLSDSVINLTFGEKPASIHEIITRLKVCKLRWGVNACIIDPYNELDHTRPPGQTEAEYISEFLATLRNFGRIYDMAIWIVAHPTKLQKNEKTGEYPCPTPYDISGAAHWRNKADVCIAVWRPTKEESHVVDVHIQKVRNKNLGRTGSVKLKWTRATGVFSETTSPGEPGGNVDF